MKLKKSLIVNMLGEAVYLMGMQTLTYRERDVVQVHYFNRENKLGLSPEYFNEVLTEAENKLMYYLKLHESWLKAK